MGKCGQTLKVFTLLLFDRGIVVKLILPVQHVRNPAVELRLPLELHFINTHYSRKKEREGKRERETERLRQVKFETQGYWIYHTANEK